MGNNLNKGGQIVLRNMSKNGNIHGIYFKKNLPPIEGDDPTSPDFSKHYMDKLIKDEGGHDYAESEEHKSGFSKQFMDEVMKNEDKAEAAD